MIADVRVTSPIRYFGGKGKLAPKLLPLIPPHQTYCEPFAGSLALLFAKSPSPVEVVGDLDGNLCNLYRVLQNRQTFEEFARRVALTPYCRQIWREDKDLYQAEQDPVEKAARYFTAARQAFGGDLRVASWANGVTESSRGMAGTVACWLSAVEALPEFHLRLQRVQIEHDDYRRVIRLYDHANAFHYLDPPYVPTTRTRPDHGYNHEMTVEDHRDLVELLLGVEGKVMLSGYPNEVYVPLEAAGWMVVDFEMPVAMRNKYAHKSGMTWRTERVWMNYQVGQQRLW